ncbi:spore coat protein B [Bacillaceae bacterium]
MNGMTSPALASMVGKVVRIDRGGPESRNGRLIDVKADHLVLHNGEEGVIYYQTKHVKSISVDSRDYSDEGYLPKPRYLNVENFNAVLQNMKGRWVQVNRGGPESVQGVLSDVSDDQLILVIKNELMRIFIYHVRNISYVHQAHEKKEREKMTESKENAENSRVDTKEETMRKNAKK